MIRLGNIEFSNCYPIHGPLLDDGPTPPWLRVRHGTPGELNAALARAELDVAPASSIEFARHFREYRVLDGLCIGSEDSVQSIVLVSREPLSGLDACRVAVPTASASARCLLRILLGLRYGIEPQWCDFDQEDPDRPEEGLAAATLYIGDAALRHGVGRGEHRYDLGAEWYSWTGLPFVWALWLVREEAARQPETVLLHQRLLEARDAAESRLPELARRVAPRYGLSRSLLEAYWTRIGYVLTASMRAGLLRFFELAAEIGEAPPVRELRLLG